MNTHRHTIFGKATWSTVLSETTYSQDKARNRVQKIKAGVETDSSYNDSWPCIRRGFWIDGQGHRRSLCAGGLIKQDKEAVGNI